ncbi:MAG: hypothetical protein HYV38_02675 [Candidatus Levybacteria bacterium]|nr:hypothetical protein [Candidatus Levybacteria bacterium]MBI2420962.1 hypothetical protein [Candidatus Levybacteria bacterium]MBI4097758.1 hypothetical protein [Candidatus Levybacteria bacterium]
MDPEVSEERLSEIESLILERLLTEWEEGSISEAESAEIANFVLDELDFVYTEEDLMFFLQDLTSKWKFFANILSIETGKHSEQESSELAKDALQLAREGKIDDALSLAKGGAN